MSRLNIWNCTNCTYRHDFPGPRCVMCGELRNATRQQMLDFIAGKTLKKAGDDDVVVVDTWVPQDSSSMEAECVVEVSSPVGTSNMTALARQVDKENHKQFATTNQKSLTNPYRKKKGAKATHTSMTINTTACNPSSAVSGNADFWQHDGTNTAHFRAVSLHPNSPPSQFPVDNPTAIAKTTAENSLMLLQPQPKRPSAKISLQNHFPFPAKPMPYSKGHVPYCPQASKTWIYPRHPDYPSRQYQLEITEKAIHHNTLVSLPTGLGKTLIAAVVMYNYWRWFPTGKVIFLAPTLPLVNQQVQACYKIMGLPAGATAVLTGKLSREKRLEYWKERRVFYCTPQTVQKDLIESDEFATQVVCLVLDEAHKATGDYAYVKVVEQLEAAGAKFRIVGLSATPGTSIKAIQQVVHALRSHCIEARHEADPSVQPYLHEKISEIVIVPRNDSQRQVERHLTNMLTPILEQLRQMGAIRLNGNATLTPFQIFQAKKDFAQRHNGQVPGHVSGLYAMAHKLVEIRNDAHQSLGVVRTKLFRLRNEPQRGMLSTLVKSEQFQEVIDLVQDATAANPGITLSQQQGGSSRNNPKLTKLAELLKEHFCRAQACGKSSRVIVFSQFRDSVAEIVLLLRTLEPTIRPHHFVGQGKPLRGTSKKKTADETCDEVIRLNGMRQSEQQQVIQEFRNDKYNVLVCTCIGEEGLDIGEVDLIVNYDTLRSPIRMIQRTGRTGRARDGRVVCLIAEGQEQRTYEQSKQAEKTLMRALEKKSNFVFHPDILLFPTPPQERQFMTMEIGSLLHLSQVAGANSTSTRKTIGSKASKCKLDAAQEQERQQRLGDLVVLDINTVPWRTLRRVLIRHRSLHQYQGGRTLRILKALEYLGSTHYGANNSGKVSRMNAAIHNIFPTEKPPTAPMRQNDRSDGYSTEFIDDGAVTKSTDEEPKRDDHTRVQTSHQEVNLRLNIATTDFANEPTTRLHRSGVLPSPTENSNCHDGSRRHSGELEISEDNQKENPIEIEPKTKEQNLPLHIDAVEVNGAKSIFQPDDSAQGPEFRLPTPPPSSSDDESSQDEDSCFVYSKARTKNRKHISHRNKSASNANVEAILDRDPNLKREANVQFCLPTQSSSSEDENMSDVDEKHSEPEVLSPVKGNGIASVGWSPTRGTDYPSNCRREFTMMKSPESDSDNEDIPLISLRIRKRRKPTNLQKEGRKAKLRTTMTSKASPEFRLPFEATTVDSTPSPKVSTKAKGRRRVCVIDDGVSQADSTSIFPASGISDVEVETQPTSSRKSLNANEELQDTPDHLDRSIQKNTQYNLQPRDRFPGPIQSALTDTPLTSRSRTSVEAENITCQVCFSRESFDDDPLIICDCCELGFHKSCYNIEASIESVEPWYCDLCKSRKDGGNDDRACLLCDGDSGAMKRHDAGWCHPICLPFINDGSSSLTQRPCLHCSSGGGARCFSCTATMHPYCAIHKRQRDYWTIVVVEPTNTAEGKKAALFCHQHTNNVNTFISLLSHDDASGIFPSIKLIQTRELVSLPQERGPKLDQLKRLKIRSATRKKDYRDTGRLSRRERIKRRRLGATKFVLEEAEIGSDEDMDGDEDDELCQVEEDELSKDSFINDSADLTQYFSQDNLADVDPDASTEVDMCHHRALDIQREMEQQFQTPILNRRMIRVEESPFASSSEKGVGNMHFVRSVLEHHRQGGRTEEIEEYFRQLEQGDQSEDRSVPNSA